MEGRPMASEYYKVTEVADLFKVTRQAVYKWINEGQLRAVKVGESTRIRADDLAAFEKEVPVQKAGQTEGNK